MTSERYGTLKERSAKRLALLVEIAVEEHLLMCRKHLLSRVYRVLQATYQIGESLRLFVPFVPKCHRHLISFQQR